MKHRLEREYLKVGVDKISPEQRGISSTGNEGNDNANNKEKK